MAHRATASTTRPASAVSDDRPSRPASAGSSRAKAPAPTTPDRLNLTRLGRLPEPPPWRRFDHLDAERALTFLPEREHIDRVNAALYLRRPLLITGEPGGGKTTLVYAVAREEPYLVANGEVHCRGLPLVVMTSKGERDFPPAFRRRCLELRMRPPNTDRLRRILRAHLSGVPATGGDAGRQMGRQRWRAQEAEVERLIEGFCALHDSKTRRLATDQLLQAVQLVCAGACRTKSPSTPGVR